MTCGGQGNIKRVLFSTQKGKTSPKKRGEIEKVHPKSSNKRHIDLLDFGPPKAKKRFKFFIIYLSSNMLKFIGVHAWRV